MATKETIRLTRPSGDYTVTVLQRGPENVTFTVNNESFHYRLDSAVFDAFVKQFRAGHFAA